VVAELAEDADRTTTRLDTAMEALLRPSGPHLVPDELDAVVVAHAREVRPRR
jgi:hypothetical protein